MAGHDVHFKRRTDAPDGFFAAEAAGLRWLAAAESAGGARIARVEAVTATTISLERIDSARPGRVAAVAFGRALAVTHAAGAEAFGCGPDGGPGVAWIGRQRLPLGSFASWGEFYATARLLPFARAARDVGHLSERAVRLVERVCERLTAGEFEDGRAPARIHGDLWSGNLLWSSSGAVLIDPAAHGGHAETDLAMLALFGLPHLDVVLESYSEAAGLPSDWRDRIGLHQLHPLLVHAVSHGPSYGREAERVADGYA